MTIQTILTSLSMANQENFLLTPEDLESCLQAYGSVSVKLLIHSSRETNDIYDAGEIKFYIIAGTFAFAIPNVWLLLAQFC